MEAISIFDDNACEPRVEYRGKIDDEIRYYLDLAGYCLNSPLLDGSDVAFLKFFVLTLLVRHHLAEVWGDPMGEVAAMLEKDYRRTADCCVAVCLGAEIALAAFRRHGRLRDAAFLGLQLAKPETFLCGAGVSMPNRRLGLWTQRRSLDFCEIRDLSPDIGNHAAAENGTRGTSRSLHIPLSTTQLLAFTHLVK